MYSNNLNGSYEYESERRNDERRAAEDRRRLRDLGGKHRLSLPSLRAIVGILVVLIAVIRAI